MRVKPTRERVSISGCDGQRLAGLLDLPAGEPRAIALLAHCFTCSKDTIAGARIARGLSAAGFGVLRIDFTGLGDSEGEFADTTFSSNIEDLVLAADFLRERGQAPDLLIGHSLGGTAALAAVRFIPEARAVATVNSPADLAGVARLFRAQAAELERDGEAVVALAGRPTLIRQGFIEDLALHSIPQCVAEVGRPLLVLHAPEDRQVPFSAAEALSAHGGTLVALDGADHMLLRPGAAAQVVERIADWFLALQARRP